MLLAPGNDVAASYTCPILQQMTSPHLRYSPL
jgi:hypothetical protein